MKVSKGPKLRDNHRISTFHNLRGLYRTSHETNLMNREGPSDWPSPEHPCGWMEKNHASAQTPTWIAGKEASDPAQSIASEALMFKNNACARERGRELAFHMLNPCLIPAPLMVLWSLPGVIQEHKPGVCLKTIITIILTLMQQQCYDNAMKTKPFTAVRVGSRRKVAVSPPLGNGGNSGALERALKPIGQLRTEFEFPDLTIPVFLGDPNAHLLTPFQSSLINCTHKRWEGSVWAPASRLADCAWGPACLLQTHQLQIES